MPDYFDLVRSHWLRSSGRTGNVSCRLSRRVFQSLHQGDSRAGRGRSNGGTRMDTISGQLDVGCYSSSCLGRGGRVFAVERSSRDCLNVSYFFVVRENRSASEMSSRLLRQSAFICGGSSIGRAGNPTVRVAVRVRPLRSSSLNHLIECAEMFWQTALARSWLIEPNRKCCV